jgi:hypothetical protein
MGPNDRWSRKNPVRHGSGDGTHPPTVQAQRDGVHVLIHNTFGARLNVTDAGPKGSLTYIADGFGGWLVSEGSGCSD